MTYVPIYLPDGEQFSVEWYISDGKAVGVERMNDQWVRHNVGPRRDTGFRADSIRDACERVSARTKIDFVRDVRGK